MEDPAEDVFVSNVITSQGNSRIFEGIWESQGFWTQEAISTLESFNETNEARDILRSAVALLGLSEALAARCQLPRYCMGGGENKSEMDLPNLDALSQRAGLLIFTDSDLETAKVDRGDLRPFIHDGNPSRDLFKLHVQSECRPLLMYGQSILVALPSVLAITVRQYIEEEVKRRGLTDLYQRRLLSRQLRVALESGPGHLDTEIPDSEFPPLPEGGGAIAQMVVGFDVDKCAHVLFVSSPMEGNEQEANLGFNAALSKHCESTAASLAARHAAGGGLTIVIQGGSGGAMMFGVNSVPSNWHIAAFSLPDWLMLGRLGETELLELWNVLQKESELAKRGIQIANFNGVLNLFAYWKSKGERLVPPHGPAKNAQIMVPTDEIAHLRREVQLNYDVHAVRRRNPDEWVAVRRLTVEAYFKEVERQPIYVDEAAGKRGLLREW